ncbi:MAG: LysM peptidoglycan-binding domain-containing protein [Planctomycetota bacterium]|nr:LysM peptidoglycan-binding domain-containing protein [Planctomycetota bacterium]
MQPIERYGVIALVVLVLIIGAFALWKDPAAAASSGNASKAVARNDRAAEKLTIPVRTRPGRGLRKQGAETASRGQEQPPASGYGDVIPNLGPTAKGALTPETLEPIETERWRPTRSQEQPQRRPQEPKPRPGSRQLYTVQSGDTLSEISLRELGTSKRWPEIVKLNLGLDPARLKVGSRLVMPRVSDDALLARGARGATGAAPANKGGTTYVVRANDSLWKIAARTLRDGERWHEIAALNPEIDPDRLRVGQALALPRGALVGSERASAAAAPTAERPKKGKVL